MRFNAFAKYALIILLYNLAAVAWGVYVRASVSGDGCGSHWPLCDGSHEPISGAGARIVELSHRISTGIIGPMALALVIWAFRKYPKGHLVKHASVMFLVMTLVEGLVGAALVKFELVAKNDSAARAAVMGFHVISTFLLLGALAVALLAGNRPDSQLHIGRIKLRGQGTVGWMLVAGAAGIIMLGLTGAISALGHQLHETANVLAAAKNPATHWMVRLQPGHPYFALSFGLYLVLAVSLLQHLRPDPRVRLAAKWVVGLYVSQLLFGLLNIWFKAPIPMQMGHLVLADLNWISLIVLSSVALSEGIERVESRPAPAEAPEVEALSGKKLIKAYVALTKPRVISLLLFTTLSAMIAAQGGWPGLTLFVAVAVGGYMAAGAANTINMVIDRDIDLSMVRTASRPTVSQSISSTHALTFAAVLAVGSFGLLWGVANLLSALMALSGLVFYVVIYTMMLKRRTWHNIVIGGAAGAFPPLVGWAAVTGDLPPLAIYLFAIIFVWTPVHFWALALLLKDEYAAAGVPMLPVVKGDRYTVTQIGAYTAITVVVTLIPFFLPKIVLPKVGWLYAVSALILNAFLVRFFWRLRQQVDRPRASGLFHYSMLYLAILFLMLAVDRAFIGGVS